MLSVDEVLAIISEKVTPVAAEEVELSDAGGAVLAQPLQMKEESPPFDRAQLDGFAVRAGDFSAGVMPAGTELRRIGQIDAGGTGLGRPLEMGECAAINTGAVMPEGADAVLMVEYSLQEGATVRAGRAVTVGYGVQRRGSDAAAGQVVLQTGRRLLPPALAVCAAAGAGRVMVRQLRASLLTTGDELVAAGETPGRGQIRNSNGPMLQALLRAETPFVNDLGICGDDASRLRNLLRQGLEHSDLLVVSGGMSMGTRDLVPPLLKELGVTFYVEKVRMKPGKPVVIGSFRKPSGAISYVAGLPGNPVSGFVTFQRFVRHLMGRLLGLTETPRLLEAELTTPLPANGDREFYQPCRLGQRGAVMVAEPLGWKGSADLFTLVEAAGLLIRPASAPEAAPGSMVQVLRL